jgi:hypothetical protein
LQRVGEVDELAAPLALHGAMMHVIVRRQKLMDISRIVDVCSASFDHQIALKRAAVVAEHGHVVGKTRPVLRDESVQILAVLCGILAFLS